MNIYSRDDERAIRVQRLVDDWTASGLLQPEQRERLRPTLLVNLRRTNKFLRVTLFVFGLIVVTALVGLVSLFDEDSSSWLALLAAAACFAAAQTAISRYRLYHFGIEEAVASAAVLFVALFAATAFVTGFSTVAAFTAAAGGAYVLFIRFGYLYAGIAATLLAPMAVMDAAETDTVRRLLAFVLLLTIFFVSRERREDHDPDYPADAYGVIEGVAWAAMYVVANLKVSSWLSSPDEVPLFYWGTYVVIWMLPVAGLWIAIRDRHRMMLDVNIVLAIVTLMTNKPYLGGESKAWDPILFGVMLIVVAIGLRRWLRTGPDGSRRGFIAERILASEREKLALAGSATVLVPGAPATQAHESPSAGGRSGGAGASGKF